MMLHKICDCWHFLYQAKMQKLYISILGLCLLACFQLSYANFAAEIGWLVRTWVCQANYQQELQNAQQNNPKAQVVAPKFQVNFF